MTNRLGSLPSGATYTWTADPIYISSGKSKILLR